MALKHVTTLRETYHSTQSLRPAAKTKLFRPRVARPGPAKRSAVMVDNEVSVLAKLTF